MKILTDQLEFGTQGNTDIVNITEPVVTKLKKSGLKEGVAFLFAVGSTVGLTTCEFEPGLVEDLKAMFDKLIPRSAPYAHDATWGDANGFSHLRASLLGPSLAVPFKAGALALGKWQQIVLIDFDNTPRQRRVVIQFQGEP